MLSVKIGLYHPLLENSFVNVIQTLKKDDPLTPLVVVAPTNSMLNRLQKRLVQEQDVSFMNISFMNFSILAHEICRYSGIDIGRVIQQSVVYECLIEGLLKDRIFQESLCKNVQSLPALARALFRVIQDIAEANVCVDDLKEAIKEGFVEDAELQKLYGVTHLYDMFRQKLKTLKIFYYSDIYHLATPCVPESIFLKGFKYVVAYGFYDLNGIEQDFFREIFKSHPTTLFLPYQKKHTAFSYIKPFFESFVLGLAHDVEEISEENDSAFPYIMDPHNAGGTGISASSQTRNLDNAVIRNQIITTQKSTPPQRENKEEMNNLQKRDVFTGEYYIINTSGKRDEVWTVAKEILKLVNEGYKMDEIGIVARTLEPYIDTIKKIFQENYIPFVTNLDEPLERYPLVKVIRQILLLKRENYYRPMVIELLGSPYFKMPISISQKFTPRPDLWDILSRRLGIRGGIECWLSRLNQAKLISTEVPGLDYETEMSKEDTKDENSSRSFFHNEELGNLHPSDVSDKVVGFVDEETERRIPIPIDQILFLENILRVVSNDLSSLPEKASWTVMSQKIANFLRNYVCIPSEGMNPEDEKRDRLIIYKILGLLDILQTLDCLDEKVTQDQFVDTFLEACQQESLPKGLENIRGVNVLDVMSARGIPFRVLFMLGFNEKIFPHAISEEPFLRDHVRRRLSEVLGNYIPEKLRGFDEERVLFYFMVNSARERLYLLYERSDEAGKPKIPSHYLMEIIQNIKGISLTTKDVPKKYEYAVYVPRGIKDKLSKQEISLLTPKEISIRMALDRIDLTDFMKAFGINSDFYVRSKSALRVIESYNPYLTAYDGIVGDMSHWWNEQIRRGFSPTTLEVFGTCPFKFFMGKVMRLEFLEEPEKNEMTSAVDIGNLYHRILMDFYNTLIKRNYFITKTNKINPIGVLHGVAKKYFTDIECQIPIPYPIIWEIEKEEILTFLTNFMVWDLERIKQTGYVPAYLEMIMKLTPQNDLLKKASKVIFKGKIDRVDLKVVGNTVGFRVIDYKSGKIPKENIVKSAIRGQKLQLPFYIIMAEHIISKEMKKGNVPQGQVKLEEASLLFVAQDTEDKKGQKSIPEKTIKESEWKEYGKQCWDTLQEFFQYIREGVFPISPIEDNQKCEWCEFVTICRRGNQPLCFRLKHDTRLKKYSEINNLNVRKKSNKIG